MAGLYLVMALLVVLVGVAIWVAVPREDITLYRISNGEKKQLDWEESLYEGEENGMEQKDR